MARTLKKRNKKRHKNTKNNHRRTPTKNNRRTFRKKERRTLRKNNRKKERRTLRKKRRTLRKDKGYVIDLSKSTLYGGDIGSISTPGGLKKISHKILLKINSDFKEYVENLEEKKELEEDFKLVTYEDPKGKINITPIYLPYGNKNFIELNQEHMKGFLNKSTPFKKKKRHNK